MNHTFLLLNKVQTHVITWGEPSNCNGKDVIICISGNPGVTDFYTSFGGILHENTKLPVCVIGQAGHEEVPDKQSNELKDQEQLFDLAGQIQHKLDLLINHVDKKSRLHLIGHSIGSWLIFELLHKNESLIERVASVNLLFPTLQKMAITKNGVFLNGTVRKVHALLMIFCLIFYIIPETIMRSLVNIYLKLNHIPEHLNTSVVKFLKPKVLEKVLFLAYHEMDTVESLNVDIIEKIKDKINVLYSPSDGWVPVAYMEDLRRFEPELTLKQVNVDHAFVLKSSEQMADIVSDLIKSRISV